MISGLLSALDADEPPPPARQAPETDDLGEWENEVQAEINDHSEKKAPSPTDSSGEGEPDDEIEFID